MLMVIDLIPPDLQFDNSSLQAHQNVIECTASTCSV